MYKKGIEGVRFIGFFLILSLFTRFDLERPREARRMKKLTVTVSGHVFEFPTVSSILYSPLTVR